MNGKPDYDQLYRIAEAQAGYFSARQAREAGFSGERLSGNTSSRRFLRIAPGIYRLAHFPGSPYEDLFIAWLRAGPKAVISHQSALALYQLGDLLPGEIHLIVPRTSSRRRSGIRQHTHRLAEGDITTREGLPVTTVSRTIADVAASGLAQELIAQAITQAMKRGLISRKDLLEQAGSRGGRAARVIRKALAEKEGDAL